MRIADFPLVVVAPLTLTAGRSAAMVRPATTRGRMMTVKRLVLGVALGAALAVGLWATTPAAPSAGAQAPAVPGLTFTCAKTYPTGVIIIETFFGRTLGEAVALLGQGYVCIPTAADNAGPRFDCQYRGGTFTGQLLSQATSTQRVGGRCVPSGLPAPPVP